MLINVYIHPDFKDGSSSYRVSPESHVLSGCKTSKASPSEHITSSDSSCGDIVCEHRFLSYDYYWFYLTALQFFVTLTSCKSAANMQAKAVSSMGNVCPHWKANLPFSGDGMLAMHIL